MTDLPDTLLRIKKCALARVVNAPNFPTLAAEYAAESAMVGMPAPDTKIAMYQQLEAAGAYHSFGAFIGEELIGFIGVLYHTIPHYGVGVALSESYFVAKEHRASGAGKLLLERAEELAQELGSPGLLVSAPADSSLSLHMTMRRDYHRASISFFKGFK